MIEVRPASAGDLGAVARVLALAFAEDPVVRWLQPSGAAPSGRGAGSALLEQRLDQMSEPAYLESSNEANVALYERFGFQVTGEIALPHDGPRMWPMYRA